MIKWPIGSKNPAYSRLTWLFLAVTVTFWQSAQIAQSQAPNLLLNGDFEEGFTTIDIGAVAVGWTPFAITENLDDPDHPTGRVPEFMNGQGEKSPAFRTYQGDGAQLWHTKFSTAFAGVYQRVPIEPDTSLRLSARSYAWSSTGGDTAVSAEPAWVRQRIGIDPRGGTDPMALTVIWSMPHQFTDVWGEIVVQATAQSDHVTVFLAAYPNQVRPQNDIYFDDAILTATSYALPYVDPAADVVSPTVQEIDPILLGLVEAQGVAPGQMGLQSASASASASASILIEKRPFRANLATVICLISGTILLLTGLQRPHQIADPLSYRMRLKWPKRKKSL